MVCLRNVSADTLHKGETDDDDNDNNNNNYNNDDNNNNNCVYEVQRQRSTERMVNKKPLVSNWNIKQETEGRKICMSM
jgi:hypothetical protein